MYCVQVTSWDLFIGKAYELKVRVKRSYYQAISTVPVAGTTVPRLVPVAVATYFMDFEDPRMGPTRWSFLVNFELDVESQPVFPPEWDLDDLRLEGEPRVDVILHSGLARDPKGPKPKAVTVKHSAGKVHLALRTPLGGKLVQDLTTDEVHALLVELQVAANAADVADGLPDPMEGY